MKATLEAALKAMLKVTLKAVLEGFLGLYLFHMFNIFESNI